MNEEAPRKAGRPAGHTRNNKAQVFTLPNEILELIDQIAVKEYRSRSSLLCVAVIHYAKDLGYDVPEASRAITDHYRKSVS